VDHEKARIGVRPQALVALLALVLLVGGAAYADREAEPAPGPGVDGPASSGAWFCPSGGGPEGWEVFLQVANPGDRPATVHVRSLGSGRPKPPDAFEVEPGAFLRIPVESRGRGRTHMVEWFGQWVAVGWLAHAGGGEGGVAAEPCAPSAGARWLLPDGTTESEGDHDFVVVMNPFAREAVFSLTLLSERREPVLHGGLTDVVLQPFRSVAFELNEVVLGERTVGTLLEVSVGRVAAATLGVSGGGGIRSALGYLGTPPASLVFPGGQDAGRTEVPVMTEADGDGGRVTLTGELLLSDDAPPQQVPGLADASLPDGSARTFPATTSGVSSLRVEGTGGSVATVRRTFGTVSDQAAVTGASVAASWLVMPTVAGSPAHPGMVLANPGSETAEVTLRYLSPGPPEQLTLSVPPRATVEVPQAFLLVAPETGVWATAGTGTFVIASASSSLGAEGRATYAVSLGIPVPGDL
jgi:Family of unknown function (DUF5719)